MASNTSIEWTDLTWNPLTGCTKVSPGCENCYAERFARRLQAMGQPNYKNGFELTMHEYLLDLPLGFKKSRNIFVNSMSDLFHRDVPVEFIKRVFHTMKCAHWHFFQVLTKRSDRLLELDPMLIWLPNIMMGVSVESQDFAFRIDHLRCTGAKTKFISFEPLLGPINNFNLEGIHWVIVGGESGFKSRPMEQTWVENIRERCQKEKVPFFFKQWGGSNKKKNGRELNGRTWDEYPAAVLAASITS